MSKQAASPMSEATLWHLYRRLLGEQLLEQRLPVQRKLAGGTGRGSRRRSGVAAALTVNLLEGDTLGLNPGDLTTRYLCGVPLDRLREPASVRAGKRRNIAWWLDADAEHGLLPCAGEEQAALAVGTALAARLHRSNAITVLLDSSRRPFAGTDRSGKDTGVPEWKRAVQMAAALQLPLLFITEAAAPRPTGPKRPPAALPAIPVDRNDALALYRVIYESAARARAGAGPTWIECGAWPLPEAAPRPLDQSALARMEQALRARQLFNRQQQRHVQRALEKEFALAGWETGESNRSPA